MVRRIAASPGQPFNINANIVDSNMSGAWVTFGDADPGRAVHIQGVYWGCTTVGATLQIRDVRPPDKAGVVWYRAEVVNTDAPALDLLVSPLTLYSPFEYYVEGASGDTIIIYGEYR